MENYADIGRKNVKGGGQGEGDKQRERRPMNQIANAKKPKTYNIKISRLIHKLCVFR